MDATEPSITQILGANGACPVLVHEGKTWSVGHPTQRSKSELELLVVAYAKENVERLKTIDDALYAQESTQLSRLVRSGAYKTWGALWQEAWDGPDRIPLMLTSMVRVKHAEFTFSLGREIWLSQTENVVDALAIVLPDFFLTLLAEMPGTPATRAAQHAAMVAESLTALASVKTALASTTGTPLGS